MTAWPPALAAHLGAPLAQLGFGDHAVDVAIEPLDHAAVGAEELLLGDTSIAVDVEPLKAPDHAGAHGIEPEHLVLVEAMHAVAY